MGRRLSFDNLLIARLSPFGSLQVHFRLHPCFAASLSVTPSVRDWFLLLFRRLHSDGICGRSPLLRAPPSSGSKAQGGEDVSDSGPLRIWRGRSRRGAAALGLPKRPQGLCVKQSGLKAGCRGGGVWNVRAFVCSDRPQASIEVYVCKGVCKEHVIIE
jgi:hypothetical protein